MEATIKGIGLEGLECGYGMEETMEPTTLIR